MTEVRHRYDCPLRWGDIDQLNHVNNVKYVDYLQEARGALLLALHRLLLRLQQAASHEIVETRNHNGKSDTRCDQSGRKFRRHSSSQQPVFS